MATNKKVNIVIGAQDKASKKLSKIKKSLGGMQGAVIAAGAAFLSWKAATALLDKTIGAAARQEEIFKKLETAVELTGISYENASYKINTFLAEMQRTTRYGDTDLAPTLQQITQLTGSLEKGFEGSRIAADLAASGLFDLNTASRYVAQAMAGEVTVLGRYIPELKSSAGLINQNMTATEKWAITKDLLNEKFGGAAQGDLDTYAGQLNQLNNYLGDMGEAIGFKVLPYLTEMASRWFEFLEVVGLIQEPLRITAENIEGQKEVLASLEEELAKSNLAFEGFTTLLSTGTISGKEFVEFTEELTGKNATLTGEINNLNDAIQSYLNSLKEIPEIQDENIAKTDEQIEALGRWETRNTKALTAVVLANVKATKKIEKAWADLTIQSQQNITSFVSTASYYMDAFQSRLVDAMFDTKIQFKDLWQSMAKDFINLFIDMILKDIKLLLLEKLLKLLIMFGPHHVNDMKVVAMGRAYAHFFQRGVFEGMNMDRLAGSMIPAGLPSGGGAAQVGAAVPASGVTVIIQGNLIGEEESIDNLVLAIENKIANRETATLGTDEWLT